jgi:hypothetical protein
MKKEINKIQEELEAVITKYDLDDDEATSMLMLTFIRHGGEED